jgi:Putative zinc-finger
MRAETACADARAELSAKLDGELDTATLVRIEAHLEGCPACRRIEADLRAVRRAVRVQPVPPVPDLTEAIMERVRADGPRTRRRDDTRSQLRTALIAAAAAALLFIGVTTPFVEREPADVASASEIVRKVKDAARALTSFRAAYTIVERNWHPDVPVRHFKAKVWFQAPERFRLQLRDLTAYPDPQRWPSNDADLIAGPRTWWMEEPFSCPVEALPDCAVAADRQQRSIVNRSPFDGTAELPTDIVVPLETISGAAGLDVVRDERVAGRAAHRVELTYRQAVPLVGALEPGGSWRPFHPQDKVELWVDKATSIPLRFRITASRLAERKRWAETNFVDDSPGQVVLDVEATSFGTQPPPSGRFEVPRSAAAINAGFTSRPFDALAAGRAPAQTAGLPPYRAGRSGSSTVLSYADGLLWLKISYDRRAATDAADPAIAEQVRLGAGYGYYRPADDSLRRRLDVFGRGVHVRLESDLSRDELKAVAESLPVRGHRVALGGRGERIGAGALSNIGWAKQPSRLAPGLNAAQPTAAVLYRSHGDQTVVAYYRDPEAEYDGFGIRITQRTDGALPPSSESFLPVEVDGVRARWSPERSELEWVDAGVYRAVRAPSYDLETVVAIARGLE